MGDEGAGCAVVVTQSVMHSQDVRRLTDLRDKIKGVGKDTVMTILVVNGYLADNLQARVRDAFDRMLVHLDELF